MNPLRHLPGLLMACSALHAAEAVTKTDSDWMGFTKRSFDFEGHKALSFCPRKPPPANPGAGAPPFPTITPRSMSNW